MNGAESETSVQEGSHVVSSITRAYLEAGRKASSGASDDPL